MNKAAIQTDIVIVAKNAERIKWGMPSESALCTRFDGNSGEE